MPRAPGSVHLILLAGQICFASLSVVGRMAVGHIPPAGIVVVRTTGGALVFALLAWRRGALRIARRDLGLVFVCALLGNVINQEMFIHGLARTTATNAIVINSIVPMVTAIIAIALGRERASPLRLLGMLVAFGGVAALVGAEDVSTSSEHFVGSLMLIANSLSYGSFLVVSKPLAERYDPFALLAVLFLTGVPLVAPLGVAALVDAPPLVAQDYFFLAFLIAIPTVCSYALIQTALRRAESSLVATYIYLQPVFVVIGAALLLDEQLGARTAACAVIVMFGVWLAARRPR